MYYSWCNNAWAEFAASMVSAGAMDVPVAVLTNGLVAANFSSPHAFKFIDGSVLEACRSERAQALMLDAEEATTPGIKGACDIALVFKMSAAVREAVELAQSLPVDIVLVPRPVLDAMKMAGMPLGKMRGIRVADRVTKAIRIDRFCI